MIETLLLQPRDPILIRDGRPFSAEPGARARSLEWPLPSTVAGALRTSVGEEAGFDWGKDGPTRAKSIVLRGALAFVQAGDATFVAVPRPADAVFYQGTDGPNQIMRLLPDMNYQAGVTDLEPGLKPMTVTEDVKPAPTDAYWSLASATEWLAGADHKTFTPQTVAAPKPETRTHVTIDKETGVAREGMLFSTEMRVFGDVEYRPGQFLKTSAGGGPAIGLLCRLESQTETLAVRQRFLTFGGERRAAYLSQVNESSWPAFDKFPGLAAAVEGTKRIRLQIVTPALFKGGWRPGWLDANGVGAIPCASGVKLKLVGVASDRPVPVSGWNLDRTNGKKPGPKAVRYAVPAGSVYFFEVAEGTVTRDWIRGAFLCSISDDENHLNDGFGLALPGVW